jgi:hypothetical protein
LSIVYLTSVRVIPVESWRVPLKIGLICGLEVATGRRLAREERARTWSATLAGDSGFDRIGEVDQTGADDATRLEPQHVLVK